jgi:uncharacterized protein YjlB
MEVESFILDENGWVPNNPRLPVIVYRAALDVRSGDIAAGFERAFSSHGWPPRWRDGVYDYHHYHSTAHEALGIAAGMATLTLGGPDGTEVAVSAGDALVLPVGTGHRRIQASGDFLVVGAYPEGQDWDVCLDAPPAHALARMRALPVPPQDPLSGPDGPLTTLWSAA